MHACCSASRQPRRSRAWSSTYLRVVYPHIEGGAAAKGIYQPGEDLQQAGARCHAIQIAYCCTQNPLELCSAHIGWQWTSSLIEILRQP